MKIVMNQNSFSLRKEDIKREWCLVDAKDRILGEVAVEIAEKLIGKHKIGYTPHVDNGDSLVVINSKFVKVTGNKESDKMYYRHSGFPGHLKEESLGHMRKRRPTEIIRLAVSGMLPKNKMRKRRLARLKLFAEANHDYEKMFKKS
jgi:large subunit ribosomal protein L13